MCGTRRSGTKATSLAAIASGSPEAATRCWVSFRRDAPADSTHRRGSRPLPSAKSGRGSRLLPTDPLPLVFRALRSLAPDYSKAEYDLKWSADVWWNKDVIVYGDASLKKDHPVVAFLAADK